MPIGNIFGTSQASSDINHGTDKSLAFLEGIRNDIAPIFQTGSNIFQMLSDPNKLMANFTTSPDYEFRLQQGTNAVNTNQAVNGLLRSGSALKASNSFGQNLASSEFNNYFTRQLGLANLGIGAEGIAAGAAGDQSKIAMQGGEDQGNLSLAQGNNISSLLGAFMGGGGGGSSYGG